MSPLLPPRDDELVRAVARAIIDAGLGDGRSMFDPSRAAWSAESAADLHRRYNLNLDVGAGSFMEKLGRQLDGAPDATILLAAELLTVQALALSNLSRAKKRQRISQILGWMSVPVALPEQVDAAFAQSTWNGGAGAHTQLWRWLANAIDFVQGFLALPQPERQHALADPWPWQRTVRQHATTASLREGLLYLAFPGYFLPIIKTSHKSDIRKAFAYRLAHPSGELDRDLFEITMSLQNETGSPVDFYRPPYSQQWRPISPGGDGERRAWLVRPRQGGHALVQRWRDEGFVSLAGAHLADLPPGAEQAAVRVAVEAGYQHVDYAQRVSLANEYHAFLSRMDIDDLVATVSDDRLWVGVITGDAAFEPDAEGDRLRRTVDWKAVSDAGLESLPAPLPSELDQQGTVVDLTNALDALTALLGEAGTEPTAASPRPTHSGPPPLRAATPELAASLHLDQQWLQELVDLLSERSQIVLFGPPGTGKTYLAQAIARHLTDRDAVRLVQFHPSYAYEDFFEGFRPVESADGSAVGFAKTPGPLRELAAEARANPERPYVLIVDEINRANLAKVFGELYFLLEYRHATIRLQYSPSEAFSLPPNVFLIGTMNTADRSIALVDAAIRRRFAFIELHPDDEPVRDLLPRWLGANGESLKRVVLLQAVNEAIGEQDRDFKIGPAYLMRPGLDEPGRLERVWRHDLLPLLEEHYYGRLTRHQVHERFGLAAIRTRLRAAS